MNLVRLRQWHLYLGLFIAPSVIFFALTGALQLFSLHEAHGDYRPAALIEKLASVHKDQVFQLGHHGPPPQAGNPPGAGPPQGGEGPEHDHDHDEDGPPPAAFALKVFFLLVAVALLTSTCLGVLMTLTQRPRSRPRWGALLAGALIPLVLAAL